MASSLTAIRLLVHTDPAKARKQILAAMRKHGAYAPAAAELGTTARSLHRVVDDLEIRDEVTALLTFADRRPKSLPGK